MFAQKKGTKEKSARVFRPNGYPALLVSSGALPTGYPYPDGRGPTSLSVPFGLFPLPSAMLGGIHGFGESDRNPFDAAEHRSDLRIRPEGAPHGRGASIAGEESPVDGAPEIVRRAGNPQGQSSGGFSLATFF